ncbi:MAG: hypothetical protein AB1547_14000 [Thermodesulfobacteriota bacterium]
MQPYTCTDYRLEMILLGLIRRVNNEDIDPEEREKLQLEIQDIERKMGLRDER